MTDPYLGEIRPISYNYAPHNWAFCSGQLLPINQNQALFSLLGTQFGGNGVTTFALPDLRSRVAIGNGQGPGLSNYTVGQQVGVEQVSLTAAQLPPHMHPLTGALKTADDATESSPQGQYLAAGSLMQYSAGPTNAAMAGAVTGNTTNTGGSQAHENRQPYLGLHYVIALAGLYPSRN